MMDAKEILTYLNIEADTLDDFKEKFHPKFIPNEKSELEKHIGPSVGKAMGVAKRDILNKARELGIEFTNSEFDDKDIQTVALTVADRHASKIKTELEELRQKAGQNGDEVVKEWQEKFEKAQKRASDEENLRKQLAGEFDQFKQTSASQVKTVKVNYLKTDLMGRLKFIPGIKDLEKEGFKAHVESNYRFDFDDQDKPIVLDANGNRIRSEKKADEWKTPDEVLSEAAKKFGILAENKSAGNPIPPRFTPPGQPAPINQQQFQAPVAPAQKRRTNPKYDKYLE